LSALGLSWRKSVLGVEESGEPDESGEATKACVPTLGAAKKALRTANAAANAYIEATIKEATALSKHAKAIQAAATAKGGHEAAVAEASAAPAEKKEASDKKVEKCRKAMDEAVASQAARQAELAEASAACKEALAAASSACTEQTARAEVLIREAPTQWRAAPMLLSCYERALACCSDPV
jgi:hypothetical protein